MREIAPRRRNRDPLMLGPDGVVYVIPASGRVTPTPSRNETRDAVGQPKAADIPAGSDLKIRNDVRGRLEYLPQLPVVPC